MSRTPFLLAGMGVLILGWAVVYNAMNGLGSGSFPESSFIRSLVPQRAILPSPAKVAPVTKPKVSKVGPAGA